MRKAGETTVSSLHVVCCFGASLSLSKLFYKIYAEAIDSKSSNRGIICLYCIQYEKRSNSNISYLQKETNTERYYM